MKVEASLNNLKMTPRKVRLVAYAVRGLNVGEALVQFDKMLKKASLPLTKLLQSAIANAEHNFSLDRNNLFVEDVWVGEGQKLKRWTPRAQGRATPLWRRMSKIRIVLAEREEGKVVKKKKRTTVKKTTDEVKDAVVEEGKAVVSAKKTGAAIPQKTVTHGKTRGAGFTKKTFQRKSV
jgi:large subunit ribosomal protein L22